MPDLEVILRDGLTDLTEQAQHSEPVEIVPTVPISFVFTCPVAFTTNQQNLTFYIKEGDTPGGAEPIPGYVTIYESPVLYKNAHPLVMEPNWIWEVTVMPTMPYLQCFIIHYPIPSNKGAVTLIGTYEVMGQAIYNQLMKGKADLDKILARTSRQKGQLQDKITAGDATETEILEGAYQLYSNFMSDEIAHYEALNP